MKAARRRFTVTAENLASPASLRNLAPHRYTRYLNKFINFPDNLTPCLSSLTPGDLWRV